MQQTIEHADWHDRASPAAESDARHWVTMLAPYRESSPGQRLQPQRHEGPQTVPWVRPSTWQLADPCFRCCRRAGASAKPQKRQHGNNDDYHADDPEDIVHSCLSFFEMWSRLTDTSRR